MIRPFFRWYDLWVGLYIDWQHRAVYVCPLPMIGIKIMLPHKHDWAPRWVGCDGSYSEQCTRCGKIKEE